MELFTQEPEPAVDVKAAANEFINSVMRLSTEFTKKNGMVVMACSVTPSFGNLGDGSLSYKVVASFGMSANKNNTGAQA